MKKRGLITATLKQLFKEFWLPLSATVIYIAIVVFFPDFKEKVTPFFNALTGACAILFFLSWFTGQFNRVKKQLNVERGLTDVQTHVLRLTKDLEEKVTTIINYSTGGDSYFYYTIGENISPNAFFINGNYVGEFPTNNVKISFIGSDVNIASFDIDLPNVNKNTIGRVTTQFIPQFLSNNTYTTYISFGANNKSWMQMLQLTKNGRTIAVNSTIHINNEKIYMPEYSVEMLDWKNFSIPADK